MVYTSKRSFKDFIKSRNNKFYIAILFIFIVVVTITVVTISRSDSKHNNNNSQAPSIDNESSINESVTTETDLTGIYNIKINLSNCVLTVYNYENDAVVKKMLCSISDSIKEGDYPSNTDSSSRLTWYSADDNIYRYYIDFGNDIRIHSCRYDEKLNKNSLNVNDYSLIGSISKLDGITLCIDDAKWLFEHCSSASNIEVYSNDKEENKLTLIDIPTGITWDPTDTSDGTPWSITTIKFLDCPDKIELFENSDLQQIRSQLKAFDIKDNDISTCIAIIGKYDLKKSGEYNLKAQIVDISGNYFDKDFILIVKEKETESEAETESEIENKTEAPTKKPQPTKGPEKESETAKEIKTEAPTKIQHTTEPVPVTEAETQTEVISESASENEESTEEV